MRVLEGEQWMARVFIVESDRWNGRPLADALVLVRLCSAGRVHDVERWIQEGRPVQAVIHIRAPKNHL